jgi:hypothetical protein
MAVEAPSANAAPQVTGAIRQAARATGASFQYLLATAQIESKLDPSARASTSSAQGLFQFIDQTWLSTLKEAGPAFGYGRYANAIAQTAPGRYEIVDPGMRNAIMRLRNDPTANAVMAGAYTRNNAAQLSAALGRRASEGELYIAHFLGADGATRLIGAAGTTPNAKAVDLFPGAASSNRPIFFDRAGRARSVGEVYGLLTGRYAAARETTGPNAVRPIATTPAAVRPTVAVRAPDTAGMTSAYAQANEPEVVPDNGPIFQSLFRTRVRNGPLSPVVSSLWDPRKAATEASAAPPPEPPTAAAAPASQGETDAVRPLDLFRDAPPKMRGTLNGGGV